MRLDRRTLLIGGGAGVGLIVAWALWPGGLDSELAAREGSARFGNFLRIGSDGVVTVAVPQVESGQGSWTALPQMLADELGAAWEKVAVEPAPLLPVYANPLADQEGWLDGFGTRRRWSLKRDGAMRVTADATSVRAFEQPLREAGAVARSMLVAAAAGRWGTDDSDCRAIDGFVVQGSRRLSFGELAEEAAGLSPPSNPSLRNDGNLIGKPLERLDSPAKANGSWRFAGDVRLPDLLFASARLAPPGGKLEAFDRDAIRRSGGVRHLAATDDWIAVAADNLWQANRALHSANPRFTAPAGREDVRAQLDATLAAGEFDTVFECGDYWSVVDGSRPLTATYSVAPSQHISFEPRSATARIRGGAAELWSATQAPGLARAGAGDDGTFYPMPPGDPAGRSFANPTAPIALHLAGLAGRPVQVTLPQSLAQIHDSVSPGAMIRMTALPGAGGITAALRMDVASGNGLGASLASLMGTEPSESSGRQASVPYAVPNLLLRAASAALPYRIGYMRGSPWRETAFATESFIDELARAAGLDPLGLRMALLGENGRLARCFQAAARRAGWDGGGAGSNLGLAGASAFASHVAVVADATISPDQRVQVHNLVCAVDCGRVVNPGLVQQQVEGSLIWALGQATASAPEWRAAMPVPRRLTSVDLPRMAGLPKIDVLIVPSNEAPGGVNGLAAIPLAPAVANAIFAGAGRRMRSLPFDPMSGA